MHADEVTTDVALVRRLIAGQFPAWAGLPVRPVNSLGTDHTIYRLGDAMAVRLPRRPTAALQGAKERRLLARLARHLPLEIPVPLAEGRPGEGYPWPWSVHRWLEGEDATVATIADPRGAAADLGRFVAALQCVDAAEGPLPNENDSDRGVPLAVLDAEARGAIASLAGDLDVALATSAWDAALAAPAWRGAPVWVHGDLWAANLLVRGGRLSAVIDFGSSGVGDPSCDLMAAWTFCSAETRPVFREQLGVDDATWARGRGWGLYFGLLALPYYRVSNPVLAGVGRKAIDAVLADA